MLLEDIFGALVTALEGQARVVAGTVQADLEVGAALVAAFAAARLAFEGEFPSAFVAMSGHIFNLAGARSSEKFRLCAGPWNPYSRAVDTITIKDLAVLSCIGVPEEERAHPQRLLITISMSGNFSEACITDEIAATVNYFEVSQRVVEFCRTESFKLIEKLAQEIANIVLREFGAAAVKVEVKKFILSNARHVSFELSRSGPGPSAGL